MDVTSSLNDAKAQLKRARSEKDDISLFDYFERLMRIYFWYLNQKEAIEMEYDLFLKGIRTEVDDLMQGEGLDSLYNLSGQVKYVLPRTHKAWNKDKLDNLEETDPETWAKIQDCLEDRSKVGYSRWEVK